MKIAICIVFGWLLIAAPVNAVTWRYMSEAELIKRAELIAVGRCTSVKSVWVGRRLMTLATVEPLNIIKGPYKAKLLVVLPGGIDLNRKIPVAQVAGGMAYITPGEEMVLFLSTIQGIRGGYTLLGGVRGKMPIVKDHHGHGYISRRYLSMDHRLRTDTRLTNPALKMLSIHKFKSYIMAILDQQ